MNVWLYIIIGILLIAAIVWLVYRQRSLKFRAYLMQEAIRNHDFTFRLPISGLLPGERAIQQTLNLMGETIRQQLNQNEVESWERLTRVLTHEIMNNTAPITSISQSMLGRDDVKGTPLESGIKAIYDTSLHLSEFVSNYRKMSELEKPIMAYISLKPLLDDICKAYPELTWNIDIPNEIVVRADAIMLRHVLMNIIKNATEAKAKKIVITYAENTTSVRQLLLYIGNDGQHIPVENRLSLFVPFFTTKRNGSGIGLSLSRRMMIQQEGMLDLAEKKISGCNVVFVLTILFP